MHLAYRHAYAMDIEDATYRPVWFHMGAMRDLFAGAMPLSKYGEIRCYIRDPDGYLTEVGQSTDLT